MDKYIKLDRHIDEINEYALKNYESGWDGWVETLGNDGQAEVIGFEERMVDAFIKAQAWTALYAEGEAIRAECSGLYDSNKAFYDQIQKNDKIQGKIKKANKANKTAKLDELLAMWKKLGGAK